MLEIKSIDFGGNDTERQLHIVTVDGKVIDLFAKSDTEAGKFIQECADRMGYALPVP